MKIIPTIQLHNLYREYNAKMILIEPDSEGVLYVHESPHHETWTYLGGKAKRDEFPLQTLKREIFEEIGFRVNLFNKIYPKSMDILLLPLAVVNESRQEVLFLGSMDSVTQVDNIRLEPGYGMRTIKLEEALAHDYWGEITDLIFYENLSLFEILEEK